MRAEEEKMRGFVETAVNSILGADLPVRWQREKAGQILQSLLFLYLCLSGIDQIYVYSK